MYSYIVRNTCTHILSEIHVLIYCKKYMYSYIVRNTCTHILKEIHVLIYCKKYMYSQDQ